MKLISRSRREKKYTGLLFTPNKISTQKSEQQQIDKGDGARNFRKIIATCCTADFLVSSHDEKFPLKKTFFE
ncbi:hypothetical protein OIU77_008062 [Salix suchowensis]|uniref:Uncharacterized protein n=1 Tax=Salix suchowensis TaxID=1278906 RepID=A0ABQ9AID5_9ROSI|nr:hypothetical protein OIU77_008062 [Salix suchowensis]